MLKIAIIVGTTRPGRKADTVARWVFDIAARRGDASFEIVDIADFNLPLLDEALPPSMGQYSQPHTKAWAAKIAGFDAFVFVTPEYNHSYRARSRTRSISCSANGTTRRPASSATARSAGRARSSSCGW